MPDFHISVPANGNWNVTVTADNEQAAIGKARAIWEGFDDSQTVELDPADFEIETGDWNEVEATDVTSPKAAE